MEAIYKVINIKSRPISQPDVCNSNVYCKAIWAIGKWELTNDYWELVTQIKSRIGNKCIVYTPTPSGTEGFLHWTLFQTCTFPIIPDTSAHPLINDEANILRRLLYTYPHLEVGFKGIAKSRHGLFLCGYPTYDVNDLRANIRQEFSKNNYIIVEPHQQDIAHSTLIRLKNDLCEEEMQWINMIVETYCDRELAKFVPLTWEYGFGTWRQLESERKVICSWRAHPRWILHRGLMAGPNRKLENVETELIERLNKGWEIECDVWYGEDCVWRIGHDAPGEIIENVETLLKHPRAWIHCKNLAALQKCIEMSEVNCFFHDVDAAVLTAKQYIWAYPGNIIVGEKGVCVMPERNGFSIKDLCNTGAVCSDYLPITFAND